MNYAGVNATTNMTMECSIFYFRRLTPPLLPARHLASALPARVEFPNPVSDIIYSDLFPVSSEIRARSSGGPRIKGRSRNGPGREGTDGLTDERRTDSARDSCGMRRCGRRRGAEARSGILRSVLTRLSFRLIGRGSGRTQKNGNALAHVPCRR